MTPKEHQKLIRENIEAARKTGNSERVELLEKIFKSLLSINLDEEMSEKQ